MKISSRFLEILESTPSSPELRSGLILLFYSFPLDINTPLHFRMDPNDKTVHNIKAAINKSVFEKRIKRALKTSSEIPPKKIKNVEEQTPRQIS